MTIGGVTRWRAAVHTLRDGAQRALGMGQGLSQPELAMTVVKTVALTIKPQLPQPLWTREFSHF